MKSGPVPPTLAATMRICLGKGGLLGGDGAAASTSVAAGAATHRRNDCAHDCFLLVWLWASGESYSDAGSLPCRFIP